MDESGGGGVSAGAATETAESVLDCAELSTREINLRLRELPDGSRATIVNPRGRHNLGVGLTNRIDITIDGHAGYFIGGLSDGPDIDVRGFVGWSVAENLMSGTVRVRGNASECTGASAHGGLVVVHGDSSLRCGISLKGGSIAVGGDVGHMSAFMAQAGTILVGGNAGAALGDSLYEAVVYVQGSIASLGADAQIQDLSEQDVAAIRALADRAGFDHIDPENVTRVASAKELYHFDALKDQEY